MTEKKMVTLTMDEETLTMLIRNAYEETWDKQNREERKQAEYIEENGKESKIQNLLIQKAKKDRITIDNLAAEYKIAIRRRY